MWETQLEFWAPGFGLAQPWPLWPFGELIRGSSVSLCAFQINKSLKLFSYTKIRFHFFVLMFLRYLLIVVVCFKECKEEQNLLSLLPALGNRAFLISSPAVLMSPSNACVVNTGQWSVAVIFVLVLQF